MNAPALFLLGLFSLVCGGVLLVCLILWLFDRSGEPDDDEHMDSSFWGTVAAIELAAALDEIGD
jgi:hypothetical protein